MTSEAEVGTALSITSATPPVELALPDLIDRALARIGSKSDPKPDA
jgi:hypothetical protein